MLYVQAQYEEKGNYMLTLDKEVSCKIYNGAFFTMAELTDL